MSDNPARPSHAVARYLQRNGYEIIPVNPGLSQAVLGVQPVSSLRAISQHIDIVVIFRRPEHATEVVEEAIAVGAGAIWMQLDVVNHEAAHLARQAGLKVVMDRCIAVDHRRLSRYAEVA
ncbi:MAG: CoA-binding protein [Roseiflexaceae bacterium]|nr:CoA-binding protein [Roseiflexaceae bacterium]